MSISARVVAALGLALLAVAEPTLAQTPPRNGFWVRAGASLPQRTLANRPSHPRDADFRIRMADAFAIGASVSRDPAPHRLLGWRATALLVPTVHLRGTSESLAPGTVLGMRWGTGYYVSAEAIPQRSLGRTTVYGVVGGGMRIITTSDRSCIPEDPACDLGVGGPQTRAGLVTGGGGTSLTLGAYTFGAEVVSQLSRNRGRLQHDLALLATLRLLAW